MPGPVTQPGVPNPGVPVVHTKTTPASSSGQSLSVQTPFDPRISTIALPGNTSTGGGQLSRGFMVWAYPQLGYSENAVVNFLYNPSTTDASYNIDSSVSPVGTTAAALQYAQTGSGPNSTFNRSLVPMNGGLNYTLLFDRSFDVWGQFDSSGVSKNGSNKISSAGNDARVVGVGVDINALKQFCGMYASQNGGQGNSPQAETTDLQSYQGPMQFAMSNVYFGGLTTGENSLQYYGFITGLEIQVTQWSQFMVPMRAVAAITMQLMPTGSSPSSGQSSIGQSWFNLTGITPATIPGVTSPVPSGGLGSGGVLGT